MYEMVIGLETHVELRTRTKAFCGCANVYGAPPNTLVCPVCMGLPGALPVFNARAKELAVTAGLALGCTVHPVSRFDRKNYFYPDLPKAYQITQFYHPLCTGGGIRIRTAAGEKTIGITRIHMEEDAGKLTHTAHGTALDMNRCGVPLIEIVTEPDLRTAEEAVAYLRKLRAILTYAGVSDCRMNEGSLRCDVNLSLHRAGEPFGTRTEMKNLNSFQSVERAILAEAKRQAELLDAGGVVEQETRRYDQKTGLTHGMRRKEDSADYRYFPEPDLPAVLVTESELERARAALPLLPDARQALYVSRHGLTEATAELLTAERPMAEYFEAAAEGCRHPVLLSNLMVGDVFAALAQRGESVPPIAPAHLAALADLIGDGRVNSTTGKALLAALFDMDCDPAAYAAQHGLFMLTDEDTLRGFAQAAINQNPALADTFRRGKLNAEKALMGKAMALSHGKAHAETLARLLHELLTAAR